MIDRTLGILLYTTGYARGNRFLSEKRTAAAAAAAVMVIILLCTRVIIYVYHLYIITCFHDVRPGRLRGRRKKGLGRGDTVYRRGS